MRTTCNQCVFIFNFLYWIFFFFVSSSLLFFVVIFQFISYSVWAGVQYWTGGGYCGSQSVVVIVFCDVDFVEYKPKKKKNDSLVHSTVRSFFFILNRPMFYPFSADAFMIIMQNLSAKVSSNFFGDAFALNFRSCCLLCPLLSKPLLCRLSR